ncbi:MAG: hypothetical protein WCT04_25965 [Planctomycetota bacterium]
MADTGTASSGTAPQAKGVTPTLFWIIVVVLAIAIGGIYFLLNKDLVETRDTFDKAIKAASADQDAKREKAVGDVKQQLTAEIAKQQEKIVKLEGEKEKIVADVAKLTKDHGELVTKVDTVDKKAQTQISGVAADLSKTTQSVQKVEVDVKYLKENVEKMNGKLATLDKDIQNLGTGQLALKAELKKEHEELSKEVLKVSLKGNVTDEELKKLEKKTLEFEIKVLNERAKQAAAAAKSGDHKKVLDLLDFKD